MKPNKILYLSRSDVKAINLPISEIIGLIEQASVEKGKGMTVLPPKTRIYPGAGDDFFNSMPCILTRLNIAGCKWQSRIHKLGVSQSYGLNIINDLETGYPVAIMDSTWINSMRTAAATAVGVKYLSKKNANQLGILGCGVQARTNTESILSVRPDIKKIKAYDINHENLRKYEMEIVAKFGVEFIPAQNPEEALSDADIIVTATQVVRNAKGIIEDSWLKEGVFASDLDCGSCWKKITLNSFDKIYTDDVHTLHNYKQYDLFEGFPEPNGELAKVILGEAIGRENEDEKIIFINIGLALSDIIVGYKIYRIAVERKIGTELNY